MLLFRLGGVWSAMPGLEPGSLAKEQKCLSSGRLHLSWRYGCRRQDSNLLELAT